MKTPTPFCLLLLSILFAGCDPAISVVIYNKTATAKAVQVIYPEDFHLPFNSRERSMDSLSVYPASGDKFRPEHIAFSSIDTIAHTYSFTLQAGYKAIVEQRQMTSYPTYGQIFIIDNRDTVKLLKNGKGFEKSPKMTLGGSWQYTIDR